MLMEVIIIFAIAIITLYLCIYSSNIFSGLNSNSEESKQLGCVLYCKTCGETREECDRLEEERENARFYKHILLLVIGTLLIVSGLTIIKTNYINFGFSLAGILVLLYALGEYWNNYGDKQKVCVLFIGLIAVTFGSKFYLDRSKNIKTN